MKAKVNKDLCIGCGACQAIVPEVFEIGDDGLAQAISEEINEDLKDDVLDAVDGCPTSAIEKIEEK